jgi:hypothetical protein
MRVTTDRPRLSPAPPDTSIRGFPLLAPRSTQARLLPLTAPPVELDAAEDGRMPGPASVVGSGSRPTDSSAMPARSTQEESGGGEPEALGDVEGGRDRPNPRWGGDAQPWRDSRQEQSVEAEAKAFTVADRDRLGLKWHRRGQHRSSHHHPSQERDHQPHTSLPGCAATYPAPRSQPAPLRPGARTQSPRSGCSHTLSSGALFPVELADSSASAPAHHSTFIYIYGRARQPGGFASGSVPLLRERARRPAALFHLLSASWRVGISSRVV